MEEQRQFPEWEPPVPDYEAIRRDYGVDRILQTHTDFAVCLSQVAKDDLVSNHGFDPARVGVLARGALGEFAVAPGDPVRGRILFLGTACLMKGIHYFARAAEKLGRTYQFRVAGNVTHQIASRPECRRLHFLGRIPRNEVQAEIRRADVMVLPTLLELAARAVFESMASGVPVVTTRGSGTDVVDGREGLVVPERDGDAVASAIEKIVENRDLRKHLGANGTARIARESTGGFGASLVDLLKAA
jgi:glycosyltransferase involved in cell wall biosynthesis